MQSRRSIVSPIICLALLIAPSIAFAQTTPAAPATPGAASSAQTPPISDAQLQQVVAPIALYPDTLVSQILMAATYPVEIVEADRWAQANKDLKGDALALSLENQSWDPSVKSLVNFPSVLSMLSANLSQTSLLGDAFLADQKRVMNTVQLLRAKAQANGNLTSNSQQQVTAAVNDASSPDGSTQTITIAPTDPETIYVPTYDPNVVYGYWPYTTYMPYYYNPGYAYYVGYRRGVAWGYAWGNCDWQHNNIHVNVNQNIDNQYAIDRSQFNNFYNNNGGLKNGQGNWQHNPDHRDGVAYRDQSTTSRYAGVSANSAAAQAREGYRGRESAQYQNMSARSDEAARQARAEQYRQQYDQQDRPTAFNDGYRGQAARQASERGYASRNYSQSQRQAPQQRYYGGSRGGRR
jgi:hypothetical protein